ncbi:bestrophin-3 isoform X1 [Rhipicephalus microplus]|uniref:bestrophin-3 isoform X1 n=1 Tax=Rhipicephalus microplus TaxID=6941 RepID=UPI001887339D|nr:bestrophin-3-like isoform X1 [Rhipicephalus microplus]XP_037268121.1 bestrophin-3-like isoform X1 [Rhipicephalus microplus]
MTIAYQADVSTSTLLGFWKLVARWRGSVYKLIYKEMLVYGAAFTAIAICYRRFLTADQRQLFEQLALYSDRALEHIPLSFVLGFYVSFVAGRWWDQFTSIPWPDRLAHVVLAYVSGGDENGRLLRRTMMRYANLSLVLVLKSVSGSVKKRFPSTQHLVEAGFMTAAERSLYEATPSRTNRHWLPSVWFVNLANVAVQQGRLLPGPPVKHLLEELNQFRAKCSLLWCYDWVTVPLVYTQVVTLTTHLFFVTCLVARQSLDPEKGYPGHQLDVYFPFFTFLQFIFFMGWLKVAEQLINPFGEDDDDFETNWLIDRHTQVSYMAVDEMYGKFPRMERDLHWDSQEPDLPYTAAAIIHKIPTYRGSAGNIG